MKVSLRLLRSIVRRALLENSDVPILNTGIHEQVRAWVDAVYNQLKTQGQVAKSDSDLINTISSDLAEDESILTSFDRMFTPDEVLNTIAFLLTRESSEAFYRRMNRHTRRSIETEVRRSDGVEVLWSPKLEEFDRHNWKMTFNPETHVDEMQLLSDVSTDLMSILDKDIASDNETADEVGTLQNKYYRLFTSMIKHAFQIAAERELTPDDGSLIIKLMKDQNSPLTGRQYNLKDNVIQDMFEAVRQTIFNTYIKIFVNQELQTRVGISILKTVYTTTPQTNFFIDNPSAKNLPPNLILPTGELNDNRQTVYTSLRADQSIRFVQPLTDEQAKFVADNINSHFLNSILRVRSANVHYY